MSTLKKAYQKALTTNSTASSTETLASIVASVPSDGANLAVIPLSEDYCEVIPFGGGAEDTTFTMKVWFLKTAFGVGESQFIQKPEITVTCTIGAKAGVDGTVVGDAESFCKSIVCVSGTEKYSIDNDTDISSIALDPNGSTHILLSFDNVTSTSANALVTTF